MSTLPLFDGRTYVPERDGKRLMSQLEAVRYILSGGCWETIAGIRRQLGVLGIEATDTSISARIRDLRKPKFGAHVIEHKNFGDGLWGYRMEVIS